MNNAPSFCVFYDVRLPLIRIAGTLLPVDSIFLTTKPGPEVLISYTYIPLVPVKSFSTYTPYPLVPPITLPPTFIAVPLVDLTLDPIDIALLFELMVLMYVALVFSAP